MHELPLRTAKPKSALYLGASRVEALEKKAIHVSYRTGSQMSVSHFVQNLVDRYADQFEKELIESTMNKEEGKAL